MREKRCSWDKIDCGTKIEEDVFLKLNPSAEGCRFEDRVLVPLSPSELEQIILFYEEKIVNSKSTLHISVYMETWEKLRACLELYNKHRENLDKEEEK